MQSCSGRKAIFLSLVSLFAAVTTAVGQDKDRSHEILQAVVVRDVGTLGSTTSSGTAEEPTLGNSSLSRIGVQTAQPISISIADAIAKALENNNTVEVTRDDVRFQETQIRVIRGAYDPVFTISPTYTRNSNTGSTATNDFNVNSSMTHFIQPGGGNYTVFFNNNRTENAFAQAQLSSGAIGSSSSTATSFSSLGFRYTQPLLRNRSIDSTRRSLKVARLQLEQSDFDFRRQTIDTITLVQRAYWDLVFALRDRQNRQANLELTQENLRQIQARIDAGAAAPIARAEVETELASREGDVLLATQQVSVAENNLKQLILRDVTNPEWSQSYIPTDAPEVGVTAPSLEAAMAAALNNRYELRRLKLDRDINDLFVRFYKDQTKPQIDFNTTISLDGIARGGTNEEFVSSLYTSPGDIRLFNSINQIRALPTINLPPIVNDQIVIPAQPSYLFGGFGRSLGNLFRTDAPNYSFGLTISFPLRNETAKANLAGARIQQNRLATLTRAEEQAVIVEVRNAVQAVETARLRVATSRRARENAEIQLEGERRLFEAGRSTTFLLFQRENALTNARNAEIRAETDYEKALADLHRVTSVTLEENSIQLDSPLNDR